MVDEFGITVANIYDSFFSCFIIGDITMIFVFIIFCFSHLAVFVIVHIPAVPAFIFPVNGT